MAQINMNGQQSFLLNEIKNEIRNGRNVTHILNVKVSNQQDNDNGNRIRKEIFRRIRGIAITKTISTVPVSITWCSGAHSTSAYYYANIPLFTDVVVKKHTELLLRDILIAIDTQFNMVFTNGLTGLAFLVTKPLMRENAIIDDDSDISDEELNENDEHD